MRGDSSKKLLVAAQTLEPLRVGDKVIKQYFMSHVRSVKPKSIEINFDEPTRIETVIWTSKGARNRAEQNITTDFAPTVSVEAWTVKVVN